MCTIKLLKRISTHKASIKILYPLLFWYMTAPSASKYCLILNELFKLDNNMTIDFLLATFAILSLSNCCSSLGNIQLQLN